MADANVQLPGAGGAPAGPVDPNNPGGIAAAEGAAAAASVPEDLVETLENVVLTSYDHAEQLSQLRSELASSRTEYRPGPEFSPIGTL